MSFVILRHGKIKNAGKNAAIGHNHRLGAEGEKVNIDTSKSPLNRSLMGAGALQRLNDKLPPKMRKDAVVAIETIITASPEFFDGIEKDRAKLAASPKFQKWLLDSQIWMKKEWGNNVVDAVLHMDESTPHIHFLTVPLVKGRLCAKEFLAMGVMQRHQTEYAEAMAAHGLQRGLPVKETKRRHIGLKEGSGGGGRAPQKEEVASPSMTFVDAQNDYLALKKRHESVVSELEAVKQRNSFLAARVGKAAETINEMEKKIVGQDAELADVKAKFAAMATAHLIAPGAIKTAVEPPKSIQAPIAPAVTDASKDEAFLARYAGLQKASPMLVDGCRLDASSGRFGVFSKHSRAENGRVSFLCELPQDKVMPAVGELYEHRAKPGMQQQKGGIAD